MNEWMVLLMRPWRLLNEWLVSQERMGLGTPEPPKMHPQHNHSPICSNFRGERRQTLHIFLSFKLGQERTWDIRASKHLSLSFSSTQYISWKRAIFVLITFIKINSIVELFVRMSAFIIVTSYHTFDRWRLNLKILVTQQKTTFLPIKYDELLICIIWCPDFKLVQCLAFYVSHFS